MKHFQSSLFAALCLLSLGLFIQGCQQSSPIETVSSTASTDPSENISGQDPDSDGNGTQGQSDSSTPPEKPREITYVAEKIDPIPAKLYSQSSDSRINVRSQPSTQSIAKHYGVKGDTVTLLKQATGEGNYRWYYLRFDQSKAEGWIREDFIDKSSQKLLSRRAYRPYNFGSDPWLSSFNQKYASAKQSRESWIFDPTSVATQLAGYPNPDGCQPDEVLTIDQTDSSRVTVLIKAEARGEQCSGDSVSASEIRVDLVESNQIWDIEWAGGRYRCLKGRGQQNFAPKLCS